MKRSVEKEEKVKVNIAFPKTLHETIHEIADKENRSFNMQVITMLQKYIESQGGE